MCVCVCAHLCVCMSAYEDFNSGNWIFNNHTLLCQSVSTFRTENLSVPWFCHFIENILTLFTLRTWSVPCFATSVETCQHSSH